MPNASAILLRVALGLNLALSMTCGLAALVFAPSIAEMTGAGPSWVISGIGVGLLVFSTGIAWTLVRLRIGQALLVSAFDLLWVLATLPLPFVPGFLTPVGATLVLIIAMAVGMLGVLQLAGVRVLLTEGTEPGHYRHCIRVRSLSDPEKLWQVIRDLGAMSRYSAGLSASRLEGGSEVAPGSVRVCTNTQGQSWAEEVERLDDGARSVFLRFRSEADDFPFPLAALSGGWAVTPDTPDGAFVDVWWSVTPKQRRFGWLIVALMTISLDRDVPKIVAAMEAEAMGERVSLAARRPALAYC